MPTNGYILINGEMWRVSMGNRKTRGALTRRALGAKGKHLKDVQTFLEQPENRWLVDRLSYGETVFVPLGTP